MRDSELRMSYRKARRGPGWARTASETGIRPNNVHAFGSTVALAMADTWRRAGRTRPRADEGWEIAGTGGKAQRATMTMVHSREKTYSWLNSATDDRGTAP